MNNNKHARTTLIQLIAIALLGGAGEVVLYIGPFFVGAVTESMNIDPSEAGTLFGIEILVSAATAIALSNNLSKLPARLIMFCALCLMIAGDVASFFVGSVPALLACRVVAAIGAGAVFAGANALAAGTARPNRTYATIGVSALVMSVLAFIFIPASYESFGPSVVFLILVALTAPALLLVMTLPGFPARTDPRIHDDGVKKQLFTRGSLAALAIVLLMYLGSNGLWAYVERIGSDFDGLDPQTIGNVLISAAVLTILAPVLASFAFRKIGLIPSIISGLALQAAGGLMIVYLHSELVFTSMAIMLTFFLIFVLTLAKIGMAELDPSGRVVGTSTGLITIGSGLGPVVGGTLLGITGNYLALGWMAAICMVICIIATVPAFAKPPRQTSMRTPNPSLNR